MEEERLTKHVHSTDSGVAGLPVAQGTSKRHGQHGKETLDGRSRAAPRSGPGPARLAPPPQLLAVAVRAVVLGLRAPVERAVLALTAPLRRPRARAAPAALTVRARGRRVGVGELQAVPRRAEAVGVGLRLGLGRARRARRPRQSPWDGARQRLHRIDGAQGGGARRAIALRRQRAVLLRIRGARPQRAHRRGARLVPRARRLNMDDALAPRRRRAPAGGR
uniref:Uncharacterized protein LOC123612859 n=1 Tax=Camelus bactrianus TaxID=9837 RepID=A0A9W3H7V6_CAMBA